MKISVHALDAKKKEWTKVFEFPGTFENTGSITVKVKKDDLPPEVSEKMEFILAETIDDVFPHVLPGLKKVGNNGRRPRPTKLISTNGHIDEIPVTPEPVEAA